MRAWPSPAQNEHDKRGADQRVPPGRDPPRRPRDPAGRPESVRPSVAPLHQPRISPDDWPRIRTEHATTSLRQLAAEWTVIPEATRQIVKDGSITAVTKQ